MKGSDVALLLLPVLFSAVAPPRTSCWGVKVSMAFVMQAEVLVHAVARVPKVFMVQTAAVGSLAEDCVAAGSCGSSLSFGRGSCDCGGSVEAVGSLEESRVVACLQQ